MYQSPISTTLTPQSLQRKCANFSFESLLMWSSAAD
jgi:hypothetical protein